jgi:hypothetical protein
LLKFIVSSALLFDPVFAPLAGELEAMTANVEGSDVPDPVFVLGSLAERAAQRYSAVGAQSTADQGACAEVDAINQLLAKQLSSMREDMGYLIRAQEGAQQSGNQR